MNDEDLRGGASHGPVQAIVLAGGRGQRLQPYTGFLPKPLMPIGDRPVLEIVLGQLRRAGLVDVVLAVGHLAHLIETYFGDGSRLGLRIRYAHEETPLGTAGPIARVGGIDDSVLVMNGDVLADIDYRRLLAEHRRRRAVMTVASFRRQVPIDSGLLHVTSDGRIERYEEKPRLELLVSTGIYVLEPEVIGLIPRDQRFDVPELVGRAIELGYPVAHYRHDGRWLDIGCPEDYRAAIEELAATPSRYLDGDAGPSSVPAAPAIAPRVLDRSRVRSPGTAARARAARAGALRKAGSLP